jgi:hypothetical protein
MAPDATAIRQALVDQNLADCHIDDSAISAFVERCREALAGIGGQAKAASELIPDDADVAPAAATTDAAAEPASEVVVEVVIGERKDGWVEVNVAPDRMTAWLTLGAPEGGRSVAVSEINAAIKAQGIVHGLRADVLNEVVISGSCIRRVIAEGTEPIPGVEAHFDSLLEDPRAREVSDYEQIDYRDLGQLLLVDPGMPLVKRVPAMPGTDGIDVRGQKVPVKPTPDPGFSKGLTGVAPDANNPNLLVALIAGQPKLVDGGANVNPVVDVEGVNLATGNVEFDGTLNVKGDIQAGMTVRVSGDVIVTGTIESATVVAGGDVSVKGGIVGRADGAAGSQDTARIQCNGSVQARFAEHAHIEAGKNIAIDTSARQSALFAGLEITVGKGPGQGQIVGGQARALLKVRAAVLGSNAGTPTVVQVGFDPRVNAERTTIEATRKRRLEEYAKLKQLLDFLDQNPAKGGGGMREKAEKTREQIETDISNFDARLAQLNGQMELTDTANIEVSKTIYSGVNLQIGQKLLHVLEDRGPARVRLKDDAIILG